MAFSSSSCVRLLSLFDVLLLPYSALNAFTFARPISICVCAVVVAAEVVANI